MRKAPLFLMLIASLAYVPAAEAKIRDKGWEFGALVGHIDGDQKANIGNGIEGQLRFGYSFSEKLMAEVSLSDEQAEQGNTPDFIRLGRKAVRVPICPSPIVTGTPTCWTGANPIVTPDVNKDVEFRRAIAMVTGNLLTDRETKTAPYISAGIGFIQETRHEYPFAMDFVVNEPNPDPNGQPRITATRKGSGKVLESFDSSAVLVIAVGARTFFTDNWGIRYEVAYMHHNSFDIDQDEYAVRVGGTFVVGGKK